MFLSTNHFSKSLSQNLIITNLHYSRRLLLQTPFYHVPVAPPPNFLLYPLSRPGSSRFEANVIMVTTVLLGALLCCLCVNILIRCMLKCSNVINDQGLNDNNIVVLINQQEKGNCGVDKRALRTFPVIKCSKEGKIQGLETECVICLSEFEGEELVRILPKCHHGFHVMCIDKWLSSHSSCPTCRQSLIDTCQKMIGCQETPVISAGVLPLEREEIVRNYRG
ncbi:RING-H2 finger protein ATL78-like [Silene latifolia]|uniref:RING-H2 finger protein ATL78-like n=1 Tax=Silene latifolia TaxID=37657 RepID=UPI003D7830A2